MTQRDFDEAVARLRAASSHPGPTAADLEPDRGPPRGRPETAGQGPLDPDIVDARARIVTGHEAPPSGMPLEPRYDWEQPPPRASVASGRPGISPEARARAEAQLRAAIEGQRRGRDEAGVRNAPRAQTRAAPAAPPAPPAPPAPVLDETDRRNRIGDPGADRAEIVTDDHVDTPRAKRPGFIARLRGARAETPASAAPLRRSRARAAEPAVPRSAKELRWQRRRRRQLMEEILGWVLVPIILIGLYYGVVFGLSIFGLTLDDAVEGARQAWEALT